MDKKVIGKLMDKPMNRREFLTFTGAALLAVSGGLTVVRGLKGVVGHENGQGYGAGAYGGGDSNKIN